MPSAVGLSSTADIRAALINEVQGAAFAGTTSGAGTTTSGVDAALGGYGSNRFRNWWLLRDATREVRKLSAFTTGTGTMTWLVAMATQFDTGSQGLAYQLFKFDPTLITKAIQLACQSSFNARQAFRPARTFIHPHREETIRQRYTLPSAVATVTGVRFDGGTEKLHDDFTSAQAWRNVSGSVSAASGIFTFTASADGNLAVMSADPLLHDGYVSLDVSGDTDATDYDMLCPVLRYIDSSNYLWVRLVNDGTTDEVQLMRRTIAGGDSEVVAAPFSSAEGTRYRIEAFYIDRKVQVWVDGKQYIDHLLTFNDVAFLAGTNVGIREARGGTPTVAAAAAQFRAHRVNDDTYDIPDWSQDGAMLVLRTVPSDGSLIYVDGIAPMTEPGSDTAGRPGAATLNSADTTDVVEINSADPAWRTFLKFVEYHLYEMLGKPGVVDDAGEAEQFRRAADSALMAASRGLGMPIYYGPRNDTGN